MARKYSWTKSQSEILGYQLQDTKRGIRLGVAKRLISVQEEYSMNSSQSRRSSDETKTT